MNRCHACRRLAGALLLACCEAPSWAYENKCTHPTMAENSATLLHTATEDRYGELIRSDMVAELSRGADIEDEFIDAGAVQIPSEAAVLNHFYNPADVPRALNLPGIGAAVGFINVDAVSRAKLLRERAVNQYRDGDKKAAYLSFGRAMHLLEDLHQPAHTHNDMHIPKVGLRVLPLLGRAFDGHDSSAIERHVEDLCKANRAAIPSGSAVRSVPPNPDSEAILIEGALESYGNSSFQGGVGDPSLIQVVTNTLPIRKVAAVQGQPDKCLAVPHWVAEDSVTGESLCFNDRIKHEGPLIDNLDNDWWELYGGSARALVPEEGPYQVYFDSYNAVSTGREIAPGTFETLTEYFASIQLRPAVERGATYLKIFARQVDDVEPRFNSLRTLGPPPANFAPGATIDQSTIEVAVEDPEDAACSPVPSGIYRLEVVNLDSSVTCPGFLCQI